MSIAEKVDLYKEHKSEYVTPKSPKLVEVEPAKYLTVIGKGEPGGEQFQECIGALYGVAFTTKMASKKEGRDYVVCKLEGFYWGSKKGVDFSNEPPGSMNWKLVIRVPGFIGEKEIDEAKQTLKKKDKGQRLADVRLETIDEGNCAQMLHVGPYDREAGTISEMTAFVADQGLRINGLHHEIYLSDPRRVEPQRLRTILRLPVSPA